MEDTKKKEKRRNSVNKHYSKNKEYYKIKARNWTQKRRKEIRIFIDNIKEKSPCLDCGKPYKSYVMQFDHVSGEKEFNVADAIRHAYSEEKIILEISKCDIVCSNCHAERTHKRKVK